MACKGTNLNGVKAAMWSAAMLAGVAGMGAAAHGQCSVYRLYIQDFDQRRAPGPGLTGLPGNGGLFCTPTSGVNWLMYISTHGYPNVLTPKDWQAQSSYQEATDIIAIVGASAGADADNGAYPEEVTPILQYHLDATAPGSFVTSVVEMVGNYAPSPKDLYDGMSAGQLMCFSTSRWHVAPPAPIPYNLPQRYVNDGGGHTQTISRVYNACSINPTIWTRDPADPNDGQMTTQSAFRSRELQIIPAPGFFAESDGSQFAFFRNGWRFFNPSDPNPSSLSFLRSVMIITPKYGMSADAQQGQFTLHNMHNPDDMSVLPAPPTHSTPLAAPIVAMRMHPQILKAVVLTRPTGQDPALHMFYPGTGTFEPLGTYPEAMGLTFGRSGQLYIAKSSRVVIRIDFAGASPAQTGSMTVPGLEMCCYDDSTDTLVCVAPSRGVIGFTSDAQFGTDYSELPVPSGVPLASIGAAAAANGSIFVAPTTGNAIYRLTKTGTGTLVLSETISTPETVAPKNLQVDHRGNIVFTSNGVVRELRQNAASGAWEADPASKFAGLVAGDFFEQMASRSTAHEPRDPNEAACDIISQTIDGGVEHIDCPADFNGDGLVQVADIFEFLNAWFAGNLRTDFNFSGGREVQDIFDYLNAWFAGC